MAHRRKVRETGEFDGLGGYTPQRALKVSATSPEDVAEKIAKTVTSPETAAARVIRAAEATSAVGPFLDMPALLEELRRLTARGPAVDLAGVEAMLAGQAVALQSLFATLTERAVQSKLLPQFQAFLELGLRAQKQSHNALATLAEIRNPRRAMFIKQLNQAAVQQVNNQGAKGHPVNSENPPLNELLEELHGERLESGTTGAASGGNSGVATLGAVNRPSNGIRQGGGENE